jgi:hypothetical protein
MALDFYHSGNHELLFQLDNSEFNELIEIFEAFKHWTGLSIDPYNDFNLSVENQQTLVKIIDKYIESTDLNKNKEKTSAIIAFKGLLNYFIAKNIHLELIGD